MYAVAAGAFATHTNPISDESVTLYADATKALHSVGTGAAGAVDSNAVAAGADDAIGVFADATNSNAISE
jgi:hypothetical protein